MTPVSSELEDRLRVQNEYGSPKEIASQTQALRTENGQYVPGIGTEKRIQRRRSGHKQAEPEPRGGHDPRGPLPDPEDPRSRRDEHCLCRSRSPIHPGRTHHSRQGDGRRRSRPRNTGAAARQFRTRIGASRHDSPRSGTEDLRLLLPERPRLSRAWNTSTEATSNAGSWPGASPTPNKTSSAGRLRSRAFLKMLHEFEPDPIIFRDLKPSNIMLRSSGQIALIDFGIARMFQGRQRGTMIGTEGYAPPGAVPGHRRRPWRHICSRSDPASPDHQLRSETGSTIYLPRATGQDAQSGGEL